MARLRYNGLSTTLGGSGLASGATTSVTFGAALTYNGGTAVPTITGSDYIPLSILDSTGKLAEIVYLTSYTSGATTGTITRGQEGTSGAARASGLKVVHGPLARTGLIHYVDATRTAGGITCDQTAITELSPTSGALDLVLNASAGDLIGVGINGLVNSGSQSIGLAAYTMVGGSRINAVGNALSASLSGSQGVSAWFVSSGATGLWSLCGEIPYVVQSGDVASGTVTLRLHYAKSTTTARTINAGTTLPLVVWAKNYGAS